MHHCKVVHPSQYKARKFEDLAQGLRQICACLLLAAFFGCAAGMRHPLVPGPLQGDGELYVEMRPFAQTLRGLRVEVESAAAVALDGSSVPLVVRRASLSGADFPGERRLAWGRVKPGAYAGVELRFRTASRATAAATRDLTIPTPAVRVDAPVSIAQGRATVVALELRGAVSDGAFTPELTSSTPAKALPAVSGFASSSALHDLTVFDKRARIVSDVLPTGRAPWGIAIDALSNRVYVALSGQDEVEAFDLQSGASLARVRLSIGDAPRDLALTPDRRLLVTANSGSNSISFIDPTSMIEVSRATGGEEPTWILVDRRGTRAYVSNARSNTVTVLDLATRAVVTTLSTDDRALRAQIDRAGSRLYLAIPASAWLTVLSLPDLSLQNRVYVGLGVSGLKVDPATDLVYVSHRDERWLAVFDPLSFMPLDHVEMPGSATYMVIDDAQNALFALLPDSASIAIVDLNMRRTAAVLDVGEQPPVIALVGERN